MQIIIKASAKPATPAIMSQYIFMFIPHWLVTWNINDRKYPSGIQVPRMLRADTINIYLTIFYTILRHCCSTWLFSSLLIETSSIMAKITAMVMLTTAKTIPTKEALK